MSGIKIPEGATDFVDDGFSIKFYQRFEAFNMELLKWWNPYQDKWEVCGYHPWDELQPIKRIDGNDSVVAAQTTEYAGS